MRILHVIPSISLKHGGPSVALEAMVRGLAERGVSVDVATTDDDGPSGRLTVPFGVPVTRQGTNYVHFRKQTEFYKVSFSLSRWLERSVSDYDLVHVHALFSYASVAAARVAYRQGVPYIIRPLGVLNRWGMINRRPWLKAMSFRVLEKPLLRHAAAIHFTSRQEQAEAGRLGLKTRPVVIPLGVDLSDFGSLPERTVLDERFPELANRPIILFLSRIDSKKGLELLLDAFAQIAGRFPQTVLVVAGKGEPKYTARLRAIAERLLPAGRVVWTGFLQGREKLAAFAAAELFVLPSHSENFGVAVAEALAAGRACIVSDQVALAEEIAEAQAGIAVRCNAGELAEAMSKLLTDDLLRRSCARNARQLAGECFSVDAMSRRLIAVYGELIPGPGRRSPAMALRGAQARVEAVRVRVPIPGALRVGHALRVLHVIPSVGPVRGGPTEAVLGTVRALNDQGVCAEIVTTNDNGLGLLDVPFGQCTEHAGVPIRFFPRFDSPFEVIREFAFSASLTGWLARHVADYDLVHVHAFFSYASTAAMLMARRKRIPYLVRPLGLLCEWSLRQSAWRKNAYLAFVERSNLDRSAGLEYTAEQELREAEPLRLKAPGFVLPFGLHLPELCADARLQLRKSLKVDDDEPVVLFLSRLHPKKGLHYLIEALETLAARRFSVVVAGSGPADYEAQIREQVTRGQLNGRVHFVGFAQGQTKQMLLQGADIFALTSHSESFAIAAMEAMAAGTPVLITPGVPLAPLVSKFDTGWVTDLEPATIAAAVARALDSLSDQEARSSKSRRCRALAASFEWPRIAARMNMVYEAVLEQRPLPSFQLADVTL